MTIDDLPETTFGEIHFRSAVEASLDPIGMYSSIRDEHGRIVDFRIDYVNEAACEANQLSREQQLGRGLCEILPAHRSSGLFDAYRAVVETGTPLTHEALVYADSYNGRWLERAFDIRAVRLGDGFTATWRDISLKKRREQGMRLLATAGQILARSLDFKQAIEQFAALVVPVLADACAVFLRGDSGALERAAVAFADHAHAAADAALQARGTLRWEQIGPIRAVLETGEAQLMPALPEPADSVLPDDPAGERLLRSLFASSYIGVPLIADGRLLGVLSLAVLGTGHSYDTNDLLIAQELASCAALAIHSAQLRIAVEREQRRARENAALLEVLLQSAPVGFAVQDAETRYLIINQHLAELNNRPIDGHLGRRVSEVVPLAAEQNAKTVRQVFETGRPVEGLEFTGPIPGLGGRIGTCEASYYPIRQADGSVTAVGMVVVDVTEYRRAITEHAAALERERAARQAQERLAAALRASEEREQARAAELATVLEATPAIVWIAHDRESRVITGNAAAHALLHMSQGSNLSKTAPERERPTHFRVLKDGAELAPEDLPVQLAAARGIEVRGFEEDLVFDDGTTRTLLGNATPLWDADGKTRGAVAAFLDITERKDAERERARLLNAEQQAREQAEAAVRIRDVFFSVAAHELRTPLTALLGQAQLLERRAKRDETFGERDRRAIGVIVGQASRLNTMITALLDIARISQGQLSLDRGAVDLGSLIARVVEETQPTLERHSLILELSDEPLVVDGDALRLEQVLQNLIGNAVKYSPAGGVVGIRATHDAANIHVEVSDQGIGIPAAALPHLFQRFYRAANVDTRQISGMGVGLYVVREIVQLHGGDVRVTSEEGQGSTFTVTLPLNR